MKSVAEEQLSQMLTAHGIGGWEREYVFARPRKWRFDFAWPETKVIGADSFCLAIEIEGLAKNGSRHQRTPGFIKDIEKYTAALNNDWIVWRITSPMVQKQETIDTIRRLVGDG